MGAGVNQWFQTDNTYRSIINILLMCGTCGVPGGGWCHYVGQEKIRPEAGWGEYSFAKDWEPATRHMNSTSYFYEHTDQWRYERIPLSDMLSPLADTKVFDGTYIDYNIQSELMGGSRLLRSSMSIRRRSQRLRKPPVPSRNSSSSISLKTEKSPSAAWT